VHGHVILEERNIARERNPTCDQIIELVGLCTGVISNKDSRETARGEFGCALLLQNELVCVAAKDMKVRDVWHLA
jgi:hypothetical protein